MSQVREVEFHRRERRALVVRDWFAGMGIDQIAQRHQMAEYTVRRIVRTTPGARAERAERAAAQERDQLTRLRRQLCAWSRAHPGMPLHVAAERYGMTTTMVRDLLGDRAGLHTGRHYAPVITDAQIITAIRAHLATTEDVRAATYATAARAQGWPSLSTITARYGSWRNALTAAGHPVSAGNGRPRRWSDEQLVDVVRDYLADAQHPSWTGLQSWLAADPHRPSSSLIRQRLGGWRHLIEECC